VRTGNSQFHQDFYSNDSPFRKVALVILRNDQSAVAVANKGGDNGDSGEIDAL
jgi:hypothetical protein